MEKNELLLEKTRIFRKMLVEVEAQDSGLWMLLDELKQLFDDIEAGRVTPPCVGRYSPAFNGEDPKYGYEHPLYEAAAEFHAALEDWRSKPWWPAGQA